jgi:phosphotransferase system enzyme I (PtsI)
MERLKGISISNKSAIGKAYIIEQEETVISKTSISRDEVNKELERFKASVDHVANEIEELIENYSYLKENKDVLTAHKMILTDPEFINNVNTLITEELLSMEHAIHKHFTEIIDFFKNMDNEYYAQRSSDYKDVANRLFDHILKHRKDYFDELEEGSILIMEDVTPFIVTKAYEKNAGGICIEKGSSNSHSSIIARSMNVPMIIQLEEIFGKVNNDDLLIIDGRNNQLYIDPDEDTVNKFQSIIDQEKEKLKKLRELISVSTKTTDGYTYNLMCNIEIPEEMSAVKKVEAGGIGLFRTEFLFMDRDKLPDEDEQCRIYKKIADQMYPHPLIIRTVDIGGDKLSQVLNIKYEANPNLGFRGIRLSLAYKPLFKAQIKAILRANQRGNVKVMFPMVSNLDEVLRAKKIVYECIEELKQAGVSVLDTIEIGIMIEIPSAALISDILAPECDFFSIGTNDLVQYTLAVDRDNSLVNDYYQPAHLSVIRLIKTTIENAHAHGIKVAVCGEMASDFRFTEIFLGLGVDELSVSPGQYLEIKNNILKLSCKQAKINATELLQTKRRDILF